MLILDKKLKGWQLYVVFGTGEPIFIHQWWMNYIRTSRSPSPREIPFTRHPPKRTDENTDESREMAAQISAVDPVRCWPSGTRVGTRQRRFQELLRERSMGTKGTSSGTVGAPLKRKIVHWLWSSLILRSSLCLLARVRPKLRVMILVTFNSFFDCPCCSSLSIEFFVLFLLMFWSCLLVPYTARSCWVNLAMAMCSRLCTWNACLAFCNCFWPLQKILLIMEGVMALC